MKPSHYRACHLCKPNLVDAVVNSGCGSGRQFGFLNTLVRSGVIRRQQTAASLTKEEQRDIQLRQFARFPRKALEQWKSLTTNEREAVLLVMTRNYGEDFTNDFTEYASGIKKSDLSGAVLTSTPQELTAKGYRYTGSGNVWVHPSGSEIYLLPAASSPEPKCGPDATDWFVIQVNMAMNEPDVLDVQAKLKLAERLAANFGLTVATLGQAGGVFAIKRQESALGAKAPARTEAAKAQLNEGQKSYDRVNAAGSRLSGSTSSSSANEDWGLLLLTMASAGLGWKALVDHGARYDFKAHTMNHPRGATCPDAGCPAGEVGIITLCPGSNPKNCYESDVPGNLFYALIGRFIGWSELTLQLGSQYAEPDRCEAAARSARSEMGHTRRHGGHQTRLPPAAAFDPRRAVRQRGRGQVVARCAPWVPRLP